MGLHFFWTGPPTFWLSLLWMHSVIRYLTTVAIEMKSWSLQDIRIPWRYRLEPTVRKKTDLSSKLSPFRFTSYILCHPLCYAALLRISRTQRLKRNSDRHAIDRRLVFFDLQWKHTPNQNVFITQPNLGQMDFKETVKTCLNEGVSLPSVPHHRKGALMTSVLYFAAVGQNNSRQ